ncbi:hypothetical protein CVT24_007267 [Panaeolus cyanescens]|uniref:Uncharacterized protein n=1 Tax=Panaeolus cyanescens TaxID=181874 RepID=A0A409WZ91_9AGAR|nr:hypothetical protein CVT24_007267 [Panaeolus cyanescens]
MLLRQHPSPQALPRHSSASASSHRHLRSRQRASNASNAASNVLPNAPRPTLLTQHSNNPVRRRCRMLRVRDHLRILVPLRYGNSLRTVFIPHATKVSPRSIYKDIYDAMELDVSARNLVNIGWKTSDDSVRSACHELSTDEHMLQAIDKITGIQTNPRRKRDISLLILYVDKCDGGSDSYIRVLQSKLQCNEHRWPNRWCYVSPQGPEMHVPLGPEDLALWGRKIKDGIADPTGAIPPGCFSWAPLQNPPTLGSAKICAASTGLKNDLVINCSFQSDYSTDSEDDDEPESVLVSSVLRSLDQKYPKLALPSYQDVLASNGIVYAASIADFKPSFYVNLGVPAASVGIVLRGASQALQRQTLKRKEERRMRDISVEI